MNKPTNQHQLTRLFAPKEVAVIGASERLPSVGHTLMTNLLATSFGGNLYPVNPKHTTLFGHKCYPSIKAVPARVDLAIIVTPAQSVPSIIAECVEAKVFSAIIISAGFKEAGASGIELEEQILFHSRGKMRIVGPNCLGAMSPLSGLNATFAHGMALPGSIAFLSQSGAFCTAVLDWSLKERVGFSAFVSIGSMIDVGWPDLLDYFGNDPATKSILIYMESMGDPKAFIAAAQRVSNSKPVILLKVGRTAEAAQAAVSHTGALVGNDELFSAAMQRVNVLRIDSVAELFNMANFLDKQPMPKGPNLTIITNAGGPGVVATDALIGMGGRLTPLSPETIQSFDALLSPHWSRNPIDILGDASEEKYAKAVQIAVNEKASNGTLVILTPQDMTHPTKTAEYLKGYAHRDTPMLASWMGNGSVEEGKALLNQYQIPVFVYPDMAVEVFASLWNYTNAKQISKNEKIGHYKSKDFRLVEQIIQNARKQNRTILDEFESKKIIEAYGIPIVRTEVATTSEQAAKIAAEIGFPIVLKLFSHKITHKARVGGVKLDLHDSRAVIDAFYEIKSSVEQAAGPGHFEGVTVEPMICWDGYELLLGSLTDDQFGPVVIFGLGGKLVEIIKDRSMGFPLLTHASAHRMMKETKINGAFKESGQEVNENFLIQLLIQFSHLIVQHPWIKECDINPILATKDRAIALDARFILHDPHLNPEQLPKPVFID
jgi:acetyltransferase